MKNRFASIIKISFSKFKMNFEKWYRLSEILLHNYKFHDKMWSLMIDYYREDDIYIKIPVATVILKVKRKIKNSN